MSFDREVFLAMTSRAMNRLLLGFGGDTVSAAIPPDQWVPGDRLFFLEDIREDSMVGFALVLGDDGLPIKRTRRARTMLSAVLACETVRETCNPVASGTPGATGYLPMREGDRTRFAYYGGLLPGNEYQFEVIGPVTGRQVTAVPDSALRRIRVVPNPFVLYSAYQSSFEERRLLFTNMPPRGTLRIYTVAGHLVQQINWEPADLEGDGDLFWNLESRGGRLVASGLYIWVLSAPSNPADPGSAPIRARGKFVVIQGSDQ